jgi:hypothetical protein
VVAAGGGVLGGGAVDLRVGFAGQRRDVGLVEREGVVADLGPLDGQIGVAGQIEANHDVRAARAGNAGGLLLVVARARGLDGYGQGRAVEREQTQVLVGPAAHVAAVFRGGALAVIAVDGAVAVVVDAVVADLERTLRLAAQSEIHRPFVAAGEGLHQEVVHARL